MPLLSRLGVYLALGCVLLSGAGAVAQWGFGYGPNDWAELLRGQEHCARLAVEIQTYQERNRRKQSITDQVLTRRLTLLEAAAAFRRVHQETWEDVNCLGERSPEDLCDEAMCRCVLYWARSAVLDGADSALPVLTDLEDEFIRLFHCSPWDAPTQPAD
jgi:hypothetical protein